MSSRFVSIVAFSLSIISVHSTSTSNNCTDGFLCADSGICIEDLSLVCDGNSDCPNNEDEPDICSVCFGDVYEIFGGPFEYFSYNTSLNAMIYRNSMNGYYLYPWKDAGYVYNYYAISSSYQQFTTYLAACFINDTEHTVEHCVYWTQDFRELLFDIYVDIGCNGCQHDYICLPSAICMDDTEKICNGVSDCAMNDDELSCNFCLEAHDVSYSYLNGEYSFHDFSTIYNGSSFFDGSFLYLYPVRMYSTSRDEYSYYYFISQNYNDLSSPLAACDMKKSTELMKYHTVRPEFCLQWFAFSFHLNEYVIANITLDYCSTTTTTTTTMIPTNALTRSTSENTFISTSLLYSVPSWVEQDKSSVTFYVSSSGHDGQECGTELDPCGTIWAALYHAELVALAVENIKNIIIVIRGQDKALIEWSNQMNDHNRCFAQISPEERGGKLTYYTITFTFDPDYISSREDAFPTSLSKPLCNYQEKDEGTYPDISFFEVLGALSDSYLSSVFEFTVTINNLPINDWIVSNEKTKPFHGSRYPQRGMLI